MTFKPSKYNMKYKCDLDGSKLMKQIPIGNQAVIGIANYNNNTKKIWIAPYGNQLDFEKSLENYKPFLDIPIPNEKCGFLHYIGYFPYSKHHQIYLYHGRNRTSVDGRLRALNPGYFGTSITYMKNGKLSNKTHTLFEYHTKNASKFRKMNHFTAKYNLTFHI